MSRVDNIEALEKQLAELQMTKDQISQGKIKKIPPAVPPKKKAQPQVPHSAVVNSIREPSYSSKISAINSNVTIPPPPPPPPPTYSNIPKPHPSNYTHVNKNYANVIPVPVPNQIYQQYMHSGMKTNSPMYSNIPQYKENFAPPPPPPPIGTLPPKPYGYDSNRNEEYMPPPSPVSSNYSELARATANINYNQERPNYPGIYQNEFPEYGVSQASTYESLYEPINPRPQHSNMNNQSFDKHMATKAGPSPLPKEEEVDALTNLLVQSITDSQDLDVFGTCIKCGIKVVGESSGCTAMGNMYHVQCFCCQKCNLNLQGKPFYAVEGLPYCEKDYYETLEKCSVCFKPILDRILRATGKPYHPTCFTCVVCGKSLDGIPFTVDAMNQIHCIEDFHKKFAPRCCVCELPIMPEKGEEETVRVVALDRSFHVRCYCCEDCGLQLSSEAEGRGCYPLDDHILCKACNAHRIRYLTNVMTTDL